ncbi:MAG: hypothetical protein AAGC63_00265 [Propionicimonas sp.]|nr:hypothetical protein [Propionicimonas sp.]
MPRYHSPPPSWAVARSAFSGFVHAQLVAGEPAEVWSLWYEHVATGWQCRCGEPWPCAVVLGLAARWDDRPGWREEWRDGTTMRR